MSCLKKTIIGFGIFLPVLLSAFFVSPSYAISNISVTTNSWSANDPVFPNCDSTCLSQYHYFTLSVDSVPSDTNLYFVYAQNTYLSVIFPNYMGSFPTGFSLTFPFNYSSFKFRHTKNTSTFTFTLSENPPGFSEPCPDSDCPAIPENPYDNKLDNITMAIYTCGGILLVLYFFYCIYRIIIRNSGVDKL